MSVGVTDVGVETVTFVYTPVSVPEPASWVLAGVGLIAALASRREARG